jgi:predicted dinucleotide-binding enzyme
MNITVMGAGRIGGNIAQQLGRAGHEVAITFTRDLDGLAARARELGVAAAPDPAEAVARAEVVVLSVPWDALPAALEAAGPLRDKIVIDTTNQFGAGAKPADGQTAAAFNAARMPGARYTKSFNTLTAAFQAETAHRDPRVVQWLCGDDPEAKAVVAALITDVGYDPVELGTIDTCAVMEAPRRPGAVYGEEYRRTEADLVVAAVAAGERIPPTPTYSS